MKYICLLFFSFCLIILASSCKKDSFITSTNARLSTSVDSLTYDTVFTTVGSVTQSFKINNLNDQKLRLTNVRLVGGATSAFTININGIPQPEVSNIEINANDSIYVFVTVKIDQSISNLPFIVRDTIEINYNGNKRIVPLEAYGQNAHFKKGEILTATNTIWANDKPYVILDSLKIAAGARLTIQKGCRIYFHANAPMIVDGTLTVTGTKAESVVFAGDRLDPIYKDLPASWPGIYFRETSKSSVLTFALIKNAYQAVVSIFPASNTSPKVTLHRCIIDNAYDAGILCLASSMEADNSLISNCGNNISMIYGGEYDFTNCTVVTYGNSFIEHKKPVLTLTDHNDANDVNNLNARFTNCIFWGENGSIKDEIQTSKKGTVFNVYLNNCLYKAETDPANTSITSSLKNLSPLFDSVDVNRRYFDFHTTVNPSPVINNGDSSPSFPRDLDDNTREVGVIDIGCYEKQ
ncbi:hypothetical protein LK994_06260 [Ferruginibacter lapsinanis]|uniref:hypothetical protein n=1 Tax=Ferruginibacter lapsinanis TaxID=563172 RepID=UPI001E5B1FB9|nr:hypothetical protein [Ferruginibacter lapsinanis]UEG51077.1 hypothetical protein LK994_06260 [Ferruginibacter lapsinanis]